MLSIKFSKYWIISLDNCIENVIYFKFAIESAIDNKNCVDVYIFDGNCYRYRQFFLIKMLSI